MTHTKSDNLNQGIPQGEDGKTGIVVGSFADLQRAGADNFESGDAQLNPNQNEEELTTPAEHDAAQGLTTQETERKGVSPGGGVDASAHTKEELQEMAEAKGVSSSGTKEEIAARL